ncbi:receptor-like kinase TMK2 [Arachis stenosperma]|uniref:receptor-like kinase TMK2 n=1 Tax=Arachis stenosperma TaxID=217475 RepID=UPI0025ACB789|nr:receptor-like kinase TMK2 [Arachis stenosperma]
MAYLKSRWKNGIISNLCMVVVCIMGCVESNDDEAAYMLKLMNALKPPGWSNTTHTCLWIGVTCNDQSGRIEGIHLYSKSLTGTVPAGLNDSLSQLTFLDLSNNNLSGPVPSLANLSFLQVADLDNNNFTTIPHGCFHGLTTLQSLSLSGNTNLAPWNFPTDLTAHSSQLQYLFLSSTNLMGSLPPNISHSFPVMEILYLSNNNLSSIPEDCFHNLTSLNVLNLANNTNLPPWTFPLDLTHSSFKLSYLILQATNLMGSLPNLSHIFPNLKSVILSNNNLTSIPQGCFQGLPSLTWLWLENNTNLAPWTFPDMIQSTELKELKLAATNVMGPLPEIFDSLTSLETVLLSNNNLSGVLPESFGGTKIATLHLKNQKGNGFSGPIDVLSNMLDLSQVWLQGNSFTGPIPNMSRCTSLQDLQLAHNQLTGVVPDSLIALPNLEYLYLGYNFLQGPLPNLTFSGFDSMENLGVNTTNGFCHKDPGPCDHKVAILLQIAAELKYPILLARTWRGNNACKNWSFITCDDRNKIRMVNLSNLKLTGTISPAFTNLTDLRELYLDGNNLTGEIPEGLTTLPELEVVNVSNNHLAGNIPKFSAKVNFIATDNDFPNASNNRISTPLITVMSITSAGVIIILVLVIYNRKRCLHLIHRVIFKTTYNDHNIEDFIKGYEFLAPKRSSYSEVKRMTNSFRDKLGQGGYGTVYKASLTDGRQVAVKILSESKGSGEEFINEVASISRTSHVNIVSLLGFCYDQGKRALIYEFMPNGSLDKYIYKAKSSEAFCSLDWSVLYNIAIGIAQGLEYLHQGCTTKILHLDIKPENILLDKHFCPKISDFGLARICQKKESNVSILGTRGTPGYIAPEIFSRAYGRISDKSDVYSYGMLILEMFGKRKNFNNKESHRSEMYFPDWIYEDLDQGNNILGRHSDISNEDNDMIKKIILVSLWCIQPNPAHRPSMSKVVEMLHGELESVPFPPKPVLYSPERSQLEILDTSSSSKHETILTTTEESSSIHEINKNV